MARLIEQPFIVPSPGTPPKNIAEFIGRAATQDTDVSVAVMNSPSGWSEPGQRPEFDEYTVVLSGVLTVETDGGVLSVAAGQALHAPAGQWVRYSTPTNGGAHYVSVCLPAFSPDTVHRDTESALGS
jgi:mannose-6-phosphate isomerase-like protein (cupin superfamily)